MKKECAEGGTLEVSKTENNNGFIKLYRNLLTWEWYGDIPVRLLFMHILLKANYQPFDWQGNRYSKGQFICSLGSLSSGVGLSVQQVRTALKKLVKSGEISKKSCGKFTVITVNSWDKYQAVMPRGASSTKTPSVKKMGKKPTKYSFSGPDLDLFEQQLNSPDG